MKKPVRKSEITDQPDTDQADADQPDTDQADTDQADADQADADQADADDILPEYDFSRGSRNQYAPRYVAGSVVVVLEPDVAAAFPSSLEANEALRALAGIIQRHRPRKPASRRDA